MEFQDFYRCGTGKISNTRINWLFSRGTKEKNITKSNIIIRQTKSVKNFKSINSFNISIRSDKYRYLLNLTNLVVKTLVRSESLSKKYINMDFRNYVVKAAGKKHKSKWFRESLSATDNWALKKLFIISMTSWIWCPSMWSIVGFKIKYTSNYLTMQRNIYW